MKMHKCSSLIRLESSNCSGWVVTYVGLIITGKCCAKFVHPHVKHGIRINDGLKYDEKVNCFIRRFHRFIVGYSSQITRPHVQNYLSTTGWALFCAKRWTYNDKWPTSPPGVRRIVFMLCPVAHFWSLSSRSLESAGFLPWPHIWKDDCVLKPMSTELGLVEINQFYQFSTNGWEKEEVDVYWSFYTMGWQFP